MTIILSLFFSTFVLEDVAIASALALISQGKIHFAEAVIVCCCGIAVGDIGLYFIGRFAQRFSYVRKQLESDKVTRFLSMMRKSKKMDYAVFISRAIPGTRVPTYLAAGFVRYSLSRFIILTLVSVTLWVFLMLYFGKLFFSYFHDFWLLAVPSFLVVLWIIKKLLVLVQDKWALRASPHFWRKWLHFEFWPAWFFYLPIIPYYLFLSLRHKSLLLPFYVSPHLKHGGLIGESKWDFLKHLDKNLPSTLPSIVIDRDSSHAEILSALSRSNIDFPLILKPDIGQRGFGVRIIKNERGLFEYLKLSKGDVIAQKKSAFTSEAGVFYIRHPSQQNGFIFSVTDKKFPYVVGDGKTPLGDLVLKDKRARVISLTYFERHRDQLDQILNSGERFVLSECGNHCQGALFFNGEYLATSELLASIEKVVSPVPDFYFGRIDIRYHDEDSLKAGLRFEVIEINGAGSEATHIWDPNTKLFDAYATLFKQWGILFEIGEAVKKRGLAPKPKIFKFAMDCAKVYFRKGPLKISS